LTTGQDDGIVVHEEHQEVEKVSGRHGSRTGDHDASGGSGQQDW
jgi:hypothetical protein